MSTRHQIWLTWNAEQEKIQLPVNPPSFTVEDPSNNGAVEIVNLGEVVVMKSGAAMQFSFSSFFPAAYFPGLQVKTITPPLELIKTIRRWKASKKPVHLIDTVAQINVYCVIDDFRYTEAGGDPGTYQYTMKLVEYREVITRTVSIDINSQLATVQSVSNRVVSRVQPRTYTVKWGDCLWAIAKYFLGDGSRWFEIYKLNRSVIDPHRGGPAMIWPGDVLTLPAK